MDPPATSTLESHSFHSFLSNHHSQWYLAPEIPKDRQALAKATKDLMSLDPSCYSLPSDSPYYPQNYTLPPRPRSDSSSRTPTPTAADPHPAQVPLQPTRSRPIHPQPHPYPSSQRRSHSHSLPHPSHNLLPAPSPPSPRIKPPPTQPKPALLSPSQKKANHIQSEQKRRANIRRGYEALCECVPALRDAIRLEEEAVAAGDPNQGADLSTRCKKSRIGAKDVEDKVDGRAGPRSENVVLSKTVDYINELLDERRLLLERLHRARSILPPDHLALVPPLHSHRQGNDECPLWEREWKGGQTNLGLEGEGEESS